MPRAAARTGAAAGLDNGDGIDAALPKTPKPRSLNHERMIKSSIFIGSELFSDFELTLVLLDDLILVVVSNNEEAIKEDHSSPYWVDYLFDFGYLLILFLPPDLCHLFGFSEEYYGLLDVLQRL